MFAIASRAASYGGIDCSPDDPGVGDRLAAVAVADAVTRTPRGRGPPAPRRRTTPPSASSMRAVRELEVLEPSELLVVAELLPDDAAYRGVGVVAERVALVPHRLLGEPLEHHPRLGVLRPVVADLAAVGDHDARRARTARPCARGRCRRPGRRGPTRGSAPRRSPPRSPS